MKGISGLVVNGVPRCLLFRGPREQSVHTRVDQKAVGEEQLFHSQTAKASGYVKTYAQPGKIWNIFMIIKQ